ncbi:hypothetical protein ACP275_06G171800 [Erythranthe tilingii]
MASSSSSSCASAAAAADSKNPKQIIRRQLQKLEERSAAAAAESKIPATKNWINKILRQLEKLEEQSNNRETNKRIKMILGQVDILEELNPDEKKPIDKIRTQLEKLEEEDSDDSDSHVYKLCGGPTLLYDRDSTASKYRNPERTKDLIESAAIALDYFNKKYSTRYDLVEVIRATSSPCAGYILYMAFKAKNDGVEKANTFNTKIYYGIGATEVQSVQIVTT